MIPPINFSDFLDSYLIEDEIGSIVLQKSLEGQISCLSIVFRVIVPIFYLREIILDEWCEKMVNNDFIKIGDWSKNFKL